MSKFFISRPIVAMVISILLVIVGAVTIAGLPVAQFPAIAPPEVQIQANYVGAEAQTVERRSPSVPVLIVAAVAAMLVTGQSSRPSCVNGRQLGGGGLDLHWIGYHPDRLAELAGGTRKTVKGL